MQQAPKDNNSKLIAVLGEIIQSHRKNSGKSIYKVSAEASMSKSTWREAELGICSDIKLTTFWKIAEGLEISPAALLDELSKKLGNEFSLTDIN